MNTKIIVYNKEYIHNYDTLKQLCLMMNIEIILINNQITQNKIKKSKKKKLEYSVIIFSNVPSLQIDQILKLLKENTTLCLKAIVTATNYNWTFEKVYLHLLEEYQKNK